METKKHYIIDKLCAIAEELEITLMQGSELRNGIAVDVRDIVDEIRDNLFSIDQMKITGLHISNIGVAHIPNVPQELNNIPIEELVGCVDDYDRKTYEERIRKHGPEWRTQKSGYAFKLKNVCRACEISTIGELVKFGRRNFRNQRNIGVCMMDVVDDLLRNKYGVQSW